MIPLSALKGMKDIYFIYGAMFLAVAGQMCLKKGVLLVTLKPDVLAIAKILFTPYIFLGFALYGISSILWLFALSKFPLSVAYPAAAFSYVCIILLSAVFFKEPITQFKVIGVALILTGIYFIFKS